MTYKQGFITGLIITAIVTIFSPLTQCIISTVITPDYFHNLIKYSVETGYHEGIADAEAQFNLENYMVQSSISALLMGVITTSIVAIFTRKNKK